MKYIPTTILILGSAAVLAVMPSVAHAHPLQTFTNQIKTGDLFNQAIAKAPRGELKGTIEKDNKQRNLASNQQTGANKQPPIRSHREPVRDFFSLVCKLRAAGYSVESAGQVSQPFFSVKGQVITVNSGHVQVFEYKTPAAARAAAATVSPDGSSVGITIITWVDTPHFYQKGKLIVLYVGNDAAVIDALGSALGPQFAGGKPVKR